MEGKRGPCRFQPAVTRDDRGCSPIGSCSRTIRRRRAAAPKPIPDLYYRVTAMPSSGRSVDSPQCWKSTLFGHRMVSDADNRSCCSRLRSARRLHARNLPRNPIRMTRQRPGAATSGSQQGNARQKSTTKPRARGAIGVTSSACGKMRGGGVGLAECARRVRTAGALFSGATLLSLESARADGQVVLVVLALPGAGRDHQQIIGGRHRAVGRMRCRTRRHDRVGGGGARLQRTVGAERDDQRATEVEVRALDGDGPDGGADEDRLDLQVRSGQSLWARPRASAARRAEASGRRRSSAPGAERRR